MEDKLDSLYKTKEELRKMMYEVALKREYNKLNEIEYKKYDEEYKK